MSCATGGAARVSFTPRDPQQYPAKDPACEIEVMDTAPNRPFADLGTVNYHDERHRMSDGELTLETAMPEIKKLACLNGADAIMNVRVTEERRLEFAMFHVSARAIRYLQP